MAKSTFVEPPFAWYLGIFRSRRPRRCKCGAWTNVVVEVGDGAYRTACSRLCARAAQLEWLAEEAAFQAWCESFKENPERVPPPRSEWRRV